ncbi:MAG: insulinase family protein, partial [Bacteriovoracaceae bacterium]|nr:insulinase family protein [Bacteriovoracaceae bacterium]
MKIEQKQLKNKLNTVFINSPGSSMATVQIWFRAGSALEEKSNLGIAHFLEHMFFKGTKRRPGAKIAFEVESFGGEINAFTSFDYTCYYINTPSSQILKTTDILMDMVCAPVFKENDLVPERGVVFEEYRRSLDNPHQFAFKEIQTTSFTGGYAHPILGTEKTIKNFSRKQLTDFRNNFYNLSQAFLVVAGDLKEKDKIEKQIEKYNLPKGPRAKTALFKLKDKATLNIHQKDVKQATLTLTFSAPSYTSAQAPAEDLALSVLGYGETSLLHQKLVLEKTLATAATSSSMFFTQGGVHLIRIVCPENNLKNIYQELIHVLKEKDNEGFSDQEVQKIKNQYIASKVYEKESL